MVGAVALLALAFLVVLGAADLAATRRRYCRRSSRSAMSSHWFGSRSRPRADRRRCSWRTSGCRPGARRSAKFCPASLATLVLWLVAGTMFGRYLAEFAFTYSVYYAGLASPMIALVFLYLTASIFIYGGELNSVILKSREQTVAAD